MKSFRSLGLTTFRGKAVLIIQPQDEAGEVLIKVKSQGLETAEYRLELR